MCTTFVANVNLTTMTCHSCAGVYALDEHYREKREADGNSWHCPYCGKGTCYRKTKVQELQDQIDREKNRNASQEKWLNERLSDARTAREHTKRKLAAARGVTTKLRKRVANGTCPCCNRHFANLHRHIAGQHPDFVTQE